MTRRRASSSSSTPKRTYTRRQTTAEKYFKAVANGKVVACQKLVKVAKMLVPRFKDGYKQWHYDRKAARKPVEFIERYCRIPSGKLGAPFVLEDYEKALIEVAFGFVDDEGNRQFREVFVIWARKNGKALSLDTEIPTPNGWTTMADVHAGDYVFGQDGAPSRVLVESEIFHKPMYLVKFEDGAEVKASEDHLWTVRVRKHKYNNGMRTMTTGDMFGNVYHERSDGKGREYRYRVPMSAPVEYQEQDLPIDPYVLGVWLGDGTSSAAQITCGDEDIDDMIYNLSGRGYPVYARKYKGRVEKGAAWLISVGYVGKTGHGNKNILKEQLDALGVTNNKHIPDIYMRGSVEQRMELLRGLMDTDGYASKAGQCEFCQKNERLVDQLIELCASLGIKATKRSKEARCNGAPAGTVYQAQFFTDRDRCCFRLGRKADRLKSKLSDRMGYKTIVSIERIDDEPSKCISIDNESHLYLAGRNYTTTHNSSLGAAVELYMLVADREGAPQIYNIATSKEQASLAYGACVKIFRMSKELSSLIRKGTVVERHQDGLICDANMGYITPLSSQTRHLDGLDVHFVLVDELAAFTNRDVYDLVKQGTGARDQAMVMEITTNGFERGNVFDSQYDYAMRLIDGEFEDDHFLPLIYELDERSEWTDPKAWKKANPGLGTVKKVAYLEGEVNKAKNDPSYLPTVLTKEFNVPENRASAWLRFEEAVNEETFDIDEMGFRYGVAGFDYAETTDLAAGKMLMMRPDDDHIYEASMYWIPESKLNRGSGYRKSSDDVPYELWEKRGLIRVVPGNKVYPSVFLEWLEELRAEHDVWTFAIGVDPWHITGRDEQDFIAYVGESRYEKVRQGAITLSQPMGEFRADLGAKRFVNNHNPVDEWCRMNVAVRIDVNSNMQPDKSGNNPKNKIDGFMAELDAYIALKRHFDEYTSNL